MSIYDFAAANFTTSDDLSRRPAVSWWQIARTLVFVVIVFIALVFVARRSHAEELGFQRLVESAGPARLPPTLATFDPA